MKHIEKKMSKARLAIILSGVFALLVALCIVLGVTLLGEDTPLEQEPPEILEGEALHYGTPIAYPVISEKDIQIISVRNANGSYDLARPEKDGSMVIYYTDKNGEKQIYYPNILDKAGIDYEELYSIEMNDGYKRIYKLTYLCISLEIPYFEIRIPLSEDEKERALELDIYGLTDEKATVISFGYNDENGKAQNHTLRIGAKNINGTGYYFMVDDREYVYTSQNNYFDYALAGFESFVKATLVAEGLESDNGFGPYLTTNFYQWVNEKHETEGEAVAEDSKVIAFFDTIVPANDPEQSSPNNDGYINSGYKLDEIDLSKYKGKEYERLLNALIGKRVGSYESAEIVFSLTSRLEEVDLSKSDSKKYEYEITRIEAILTENGEISDTGTVVGSNDLIKVEYNLKIDGVSAGVKYHGVIDINDTAFVGEKESELRNSKIGPVDVTLEQTYTKDNAVKVNIKYVITEIISIFNKDGQELNRVTDKAIVSYRFKYVRDGLDSGEEYTAVLDFSSDEEENEEVFALLNGMTVSKDLSIVADEYQAYCEYIYDFITYRIARIDFFVTSKLVSAFRFQNSSQRDPYYGESLYENLMQDEHRLYGLDSGACEKVVAILGGIDQSGESNVAAGYFGDEVVALGLTAENKEKYGLYAYTIYFELPRQIYTVENKDTQNLDEIDDYSYYDKIGFTLCISEEQIDGTRYVGSDVYDIITKIDADDLYFLEYDFVNFWARNDILMMDIANIEKIGVKFNMQDLYGEYDFELIHKTINVGEE